MDKKIVTAREEQLNKLLGIVAKNHTATIAETYEGGFIDGIKYIVTQVENAFTSCDGSPNRELISKGRIKMPGWWTAILIKNLKHKPHYPFRKKGG